MNFAQIWVEGTDAELRLSARAQDLRFQKAMRRELDMPEPPKVRDMIDVTTPIRRPNLSPAQNIINEVCAKHRVSREELLGRQREHRIVLARHEAFYRMKTETTLSLPAIGTRMGSKDHTTVLNGVRKHMQRNGLGEAEQ